jgi:hypothetical protein
MEVLLTSPVTLHLPRAAGDLATIPFLDHDGNQDLHPRLTYVYGHLGGLVHHPRISSLCPLLHLGRNAPPTPIWQHAYPEPSRRHPWDMQKHQLQPLVHPRVQHHRRYLGPLSTSMAPCSHHSPNSRSINTAVQLSEITSTILWPMH